ncbi:HD-GYP domain-containing protein [Cohnella faecalis]|nr:HD domain-containing phosphohydrolase [Cohnella faecalis]
MLMVPVTELSEGDCLGRDIYSPDGRLMLKRGAELSPKLIDGIKRLGQQYVYIEMSSRHGAEGGTDWKSNMRSVTKYVLRQLHEALLSNAPLPIKALMGWADHISDTVYGETDLTLDWNQIIKEKADLIEHSLNVCMLSVLTAKALGYKYKELREIAIGSLLHDIGLVIPHNETLLLHHPVVGHDILRKIPEIPQASLQIVLQHHEQIDGHGFPHGIEAPHVHQLAQICGIASEFDYFMNGSLTERLPCEGIEFLMSKIDTAYSYVVVRAFLKVFQPYPIGTKVRLTGGINGVVWEQNKSNPCRPVVVLETSGTRFDLLERPTFRIEAIRTADYR